MRIDIEERERERDGKGCFDIPIDPSCELKLKFADSLESRNFSNVELLVRRSRFTGWLGFTFPRPSDDLCQRLREIDAPENEREREREREGEAQEPREP